MVQRMLFFSYIHGLVSSTVGFWCTDHGVRSLGALYTSVTGLATRYIECGYLIVLLGLTIILIQVFLPSQH